MEVKVTKCQNGHYYDSNKHPVCPHCGATSILAGIETVEQAKKKGIQLFKKKGQEETSIKPKSKYTMPEQGKVETEQELKVEDLVCTDSSQVVMVEDVVTEGVFMDEAEQLLIEDEVTEAFFNAVTKSEDAVEWDEEVSVEQHTKTLVEEIENVKADNDGKTMGFFSLNTEKKQESNSWQKELQEPAVGWLVCIAGKYLGTEFRIVAGRNSIGRKESNYICLDGEESVSREKHAWLIYEPRKRDFFLQPGESSGLTYVNDEPLLEVRRLQHSDIIEFGDAKFIFIPLCGEKFSWNDYIVKE